MTKRYKLEADKLDKWLAQLRDPKSRKTIARYFDYAGDEMAVEYLQRVRREGLPVCGCALGHYFAANLYKSVDCVPYVLCDVDGNLQFEVVNMNDVEQKSLPEIADWLEANVERV